MRRYDRPARPGWTGLPLALLGLAVYAGGVTPLGVLGPLADPPAPDWAPFAAPVIVYAALAALAVRRLALLPFAGTVVIACALHATLLVLPGVLLPGVTSLAGVGAVTPPAWTSSGLALLTLLSATLMLVPFRGLVAPRPRHVRRAWRAVRPAPQAPPRTVTTPPPMETDESVVAVAPAPVAPSSPSPSTTSPAVGPPEPALVEPAPPPSVPEVAETAVPPPPSPARDPERPAQPAPAAPAATRPPGAEPMEEMIRISFARVADQFPADLFNLAPDRLGANVLEAGFLLVPRRLVLPQLVEGVVQVPWDIVADQFPPQALAVPGGEIAARIAGGVILLPLDEIIRQVPPDIFTLTSPEADVRDLEHFPPPFQPHEPPPSASHAEPPIDTDVDDEAGGTVLEADPVAAADESAPDEASSPVSTPVSDDRLETALVMQVPRFEAGAPPAGEPRPESVQTSASVLPSEPVLPAETPVTLAPAALSASPMSERVKVRRIAALLTPLRTPLDSGSVAFGGRTLLTMLPPAVNEGDAVGTALEVLPFLVDARLPSPVAQATVRTSRGALVLTPAAPGDPTGPVLLTASPGGASLALLERLSLHAAQDWGAEQDARPGRCAAGGEVDRGALRPATVPPWLEAIAESLKAFGPMSPAMLRDTEDSLLVYLFLPRGLDPAPLGALARDLTQALAPGAFGAVECVVLRPTADTRLVVRTLDTTAGHAAVLVVGGGRVDLPGLARIELDRAAARLGAL